MDKNKYVWVVEYSPCVYESAFGVESIHLTEEGANAAYARNEKKKPTTGISDRHVSKVSLED